MKLIAYPSLASAVACLALVACDGNNQSGPNAPAASAADNAEADIKCKKPEILADRDEHSLTLSDLQRAYWGTYELDEVHVYHRGDTADGKYIGSFYGKVRVYGDDSAFMKGLKIRWPKPTMECSEFIDLSDVKFFSGITIPIASIVHPRSGRVTLYDKGTRFDDPAFNFPKIDHVHFDSIGMSSYKTAGSKVGKPPYIKNRYLSDVIALLPSNAKIYRRNGVVDGFEIRFTQQDARASGEGRKFQATSTVLITYKSQ